MFRVNPSRGEVDILWLPDETARWSEWCARTQGEGFTAEEQCTAAAWAGEGFA